MNKIKRLNDKMLGGVCAGLARHLGIKPIYFRLLTVLGVFLSAGTAILIYVLCWIIFPIEQKQPETNELHQINLDNSPIDSNQKNDLKKVRGIRISPIVVLCIVLFGISPLIIGIIGLTVDGGDIWNVIHWAALITLPTAATVFFIYVVVVIIIRGVQES